MVAVTGASLCPLRRPFAPRFNPAEKVPMKSLVDRLEKKKKVDDRDLHTPLPVCPLGDVGTRSHSVEQRFAPTVGSYCPGGTGLHPSFPSDGSGR